MIKPKETFHFKQPLELKEDWMLGLVDLEAHNSIFNITEKKQIRDLQRYVCQVWIFRIKR